MKLAVATTLIVIVKVVLAALRLGWSVSAMPVELPTGEEEGPCLRFRGEHHGLALRKNVARLARAHAHHAAGRIGLHGQLPRIGDNNADFCRSARARRVLRDHNQFVAPIGHRRS